jgi:HEAT repeat protein
MDAQEIVRLLEAPTPDRRPLIARIEKAATTEDLLQALRETKSAHTRLILVYSLGERRDPAALSSLVAALDDAVPNVRSAAADSLGKIGASEVGAVLLQRFASERDVSVREMIASALGGVGHAPAVPALIEALTDSSAALRGCAAWSLGALQAREAEDALEAALKGENSQYAKDRITEALSIVRNTSG